RGHARGQATQRPQALAGDRQGDHRAQQERIGGVVTLADQIEKGDGIIHRTLLPYLTPAESETRKWTAKRPSSEAFRPACQLRGARATVARMESVVRRPGRLRLAAALAVAIGVVSSAGAAGAESARLAGNVLSVDAAAGSLTILDAGRQHVLSV